MKYTAMFIPALAVNGGEPFPAYLVTDERGQIEYWEHAAKGPLDLKDGEVIECESFGAYYNKRTGVVLDS